MNLKGNHFKEKAVEVFFGNSKTSLIDIKALHQTMGVTQVHGHRVVEARNTEIQADGHFTDKKNVALIIKTADCVPVFLKNGPRIFALHIGWRGLMKRILSESSSYWLKNHAIEMWIGPHIHQKSFELDMFSAKSLIAPHNIKFEKAFATEIFIPSRKQTNHVHVHLGKILRIEAQKLGIHHINECPINTFDSYQHNSFRRNRFTQARNYSFIIK